MRLLLAVSPPGEIELAPTGASVVMAVLVGVLFATGVYLLLQRALTRILIGLTLITHGANLLLLVAGGRAGDPAFVAEDGSVPAGVADPLPQAFALTAIVITFGVTVYLLAMAGNGGDDDAPDAAVESSTGRVTDEGVET